jgi:hypothetical protein
MKAFFVEAANRCFREAEVMKPEPHATWWREEAKAKSLCTIGETGAALSLQHFSRAARPPCLHSEYSKPGQ